MEDFELQIKRDFLTEAKDLLEKAEVDFVTLSDGKSDPELINRIFRLAHSFKGSAAAVGFPGLGAFAHKVEELLAAIKNNKVEAELPICFLLLECNDALKTYIDSLDNDFNYVQENKSLEERIKSVLNTAGNGGATSIKHEENMEQKVLSSSVAENKVEEISKPTNVVATQIVEKSQPAIKRQGEVKKEFLRVDAERLDSLLNLVGEMVVSQSILSTFRKCDGSNRQLLLNTIIYMEKLVSDIRDISLHLRMVPIEGVFNKMKRIVKEVSSEQHKDVELIIEGADVELDKIIVEKITDPLTHLMRNAVDHGLETPDERMALGKQEKAKIELKAIPKEDFVEIIVKDNGKGLNRERIVKKALEKKLIHSANDLSNDDIYSLIFHSGFSTKEQVTSISGRGVGMDVVKKSIEELKGSISIQSAENLGSTFAITLPLSLSIIKGIVVMDNDEKFVLPISHLTETVDISKGRVTKGADQKSRYLNLRGEVIPIMELHKLLNKNKKVSSKKGLITHHNGKKIILSVDEILGQREIVIKKLGSEVDGLPGVIGGAILEDGTPSLIIGINSLIEQRGGHAAA